MKKLMLLALGCAMAYCLQGQVVSQIGIKAGGLTTWILNSNIMAGNTDTTYRFSMGYTAGLNFGLYFNKRTYYSHKLKGVQLEVNYTGHNQGYKSRGQTTADYKYAWRLNYIDVGLFFQSMPSSDRGFYFMAGPQLGILFKAQNKGYMETPTLGRVSIDNNYRSHFSGTNFAFVLESGQYFNSAKNNGVAIHVGLRASYGINDITHPTQVDGQPYFRNNTAYVGLVVGVDFKMRNYYN